MHAARSQAPRRSPARGRSRPGVSAREAPSRRARSSRSPAMPGSSSRSAASNTSAKATRMGWDDEKRNGLRRWWSGARDAARTSMRSSSSLGPGATRCRGAVERRAHMRRRRANPSAFPSGVSILDAISVLDIAHDLSGAHGRLSMNTSGPLDPGFMHSTDEQADRQPAFVRTRARRSRLSGALCARCRPQR